MDLWTAGLWKLQKEKSNLQQKWRTAEGMYICMYVQLKVVNLSLIKFSTEAM